MLGAENPGDGAALPDGDSGRARRQGVDCPAQ